MRFQCRTRLCGWCNSTPDQKGIGGCYVSMPHAALWVVQRDGSRRRVQGGGCFKAARGFVGGATSFERNPGAEFGEVSMPHAALWVVQLKIFSLQHIWHSMFQCRTRLCGWCNIYRFRITDIGLLFQCRTRLCGWCNNIG